MPYKSEYAFGIYLKKKKKNIDQSLTLFSLKISVKCLLSQTLTLSLIYKVFCTDGSKILNRIDAAVTNREVHKQIQLPNNASI